MPTEVVSEMAFVAQISEYRFELRFLYRRRYRWLGYGLRRANSVILTDLACVTALVNIRVT